ncbi:MAG: DUF971 domain-containing protein [Arenicellales bacterium]
MATPKPTNIVYHNQSHVLEITFDESSTFKMSAEYLRVHSPSAEVQGHGPGQAVLQLKKEGVKIESIEPVGNYAVVLRYSDDHDTGIYSWDTLYDLGTHQEAYWADYLKRLEDAGHTRNA